MPNQRGNLLGLRFRRLPLFRNILGASIQTRRMASSISQRWNLLHRHTRRVCALPDIDKFVLASVFLLVISGRNTNNPTVLSMDLRAVLPLRDFFLHILKLLLEPVAEDVDIVSSAIIHTPHKNRHQEPGTRPSIPKPNRARQHRQHRISVLNQHECWFLERIWEPVDDFAEPGGGVGFFEPGERCWSPG